MNQAVLRYDAACRAIAEAKSIDEVKDWIDKAAAVREYTRRIGNRQLEIDAIEIRVRAKRRRGELLVQLRDEGKLREGKPSSANDSLTLEDLGLSRNESAEEQKIARIEPNAFERLVARCRAYAEEHGDRHSFNVLKPPPEGGPVNGARSVMGSRVEPDDSLDFFPTPPWATRALIEHVFPQMGARGDCRRQLAWEPACGDGHIAEVLREYFGEVDATDIHPYGYAELQEMDFLSDDTEGARADWIITNPPFGDKGEAFVLKALQIARVGVAMFFRMQWLDTVGRYERIFRDHPPTRIAFFAERVPLHKGRWEPDGDTATAYIWLVWLKGRSPQAPFWIPPGRREALTRADDVARFTTHPVTKKDHPKDSSGAAIVHNDATGEIIDNEHTYPPRIEIHAADGAAASSSGSTHPAAATLSENAGAHGCTASPAAAVVPLPGAAATNTPEASGTAREAPGGPLLGGPSLTRPQDSNSPDGEPAHARGEADHRSRLNFLPGEDVLDIPDFLRRDESNVSPIMRVGGPR